ncbi:transcription termination factor NusA [Pseudacidobacterium ailaaui]|uniref:transcription termination factor NusA n=1 Tax=Pseudacidobacterium ailaaui TaxID=1382359 RepID=UPI00047CCC33|nr:transcription termination factor NusA [Pseudacidobacterium ailaaui]MBX6361197.1 transcription termination/antitermination protein NusA [Pseudacidobacterium ailaaui]MCL6463631.1 transcription termination factor NusA [Pseudacidobacterium ailaaui]MDI3254524.1 transcription termination factor NusA [Bacillota bacterium]
MASALYQSIEALSRDKGIDPAIVVSAVEDAIALATRKYYKTQENMRAELDKETGEIRAYAYKTVVESPEQIEDPVNQIALEEARQIAPDVEAGGEIRYYKPTDVLGRIAAQMAKQVIFQKVREAERDIVFQEYNHRVGEVLTATVKRIEPQDVIFDLGKAEARMPKREQSRLEQFAVGERVRVVLLRVDKAAKGPQVIVSRAAPELVQNLFQTEVPEIYDGTVAIKAIAREAGERTKIAVQSRDKDVDPVGACVGMKGMRVQSIIRELRGEKIDIIEYSDEVTTFAEKALQPAKVSRVSITDLGEKQLEVIVDDTQLSLAIGKKGQNVRLAAKLLGWKIDIKSEEEKRQEVEQQMQAMAGGPTTPIERVSELGDAIIQKLIAAGITTVEGLADMTPEQLEEIPGIGEKTLEKIGTAVRHYFGQYEEGEDRPAGEDLAQAVHIADAQAAVEVDSLKQDLKQSGEDSPAEDGSGFISDEVAEERIAEVTETGPALEDEGASTVVPGREDTSQELAAHHAGAESTQADEGGRQETEEAEKDEGGA